MTRIQIKCHKSLKQFFEIIIATQTFLINLNHRIGYDCWEYYVGPV